MPNITRNKCCKITQNYSKGFYSYINVIRRIRDNVESLKTLSGHIVTTDNDMANTLNTYFSSVITHERLNNIPQLPRYVATHLTQTTLD